MNVTKPLYLFALLLLFGCGGQPRNEDNAESCDSAQLETPHIPGTQPEATINQANEEEIARGAAWLESIFVYNTELHAYEIPNEEVVFSDRYSAYVRESTQDLEYGCYPTDEAQDSAEKAFAAKWGDIYSPKSLDYYPFGRGQDFEYIGKVAVEHKEGLVYRVTSDYSVMVAGEEMPVPTSDLGKHVVNLVTLVPMGKAFRIDNMQVVEYDETPDRH